MNKGVSETIIVVTVKDNLSDIAYASELFRQFRYFDVRLWQNSDS